MYRTVGSDGKEYGPISVDQLRQWIAEGRVNADTRVMAEGTTEWKSLGQFPELAAMLGASPTSSVSRLSVAQQVSGPATGLIVTAILGFVLQALGFLGNMFGMAQGLRNASPDAALNFFTGSAGLVFNIIGVAVGVVILVGALKMKNLQSHSWAMTSSILAMIPCISPCCLVGLPIGIWALVVIMKPEVKSAYFGGSTP